MLGGKPDDLGNLVGRCRREDRRGRAVTRPRQSVSHGAISRWIGDDRLWAEPLPACVDQLALGLRHASAIARLARSARDTAKAAAWTGRRSRSSSPARSNGVIGRDGKLPWHIPADLKRFKALTMGSAMVMGRKTFDSLPGLLPGRRHIVLTRDPDWSADGAEVAHDVEQALQLAGGEPVSVIGGADIFALFLPMADRIELTEVLADVAGDTFIDDPRDSGRLARDFQRTAPGSRRTAAVPLRDAGARLGRPVENRVDLARDLVDRRHAVDPANQPPRLVEGQDRRGLGAIFVHARAHRLLIVVRAALEFGRAADVAHARHLASAGKLS